MESCDYRICEAEIRGQRVRWEEMTSGGKSLDNGSVWNMRQAVRGHLDVLAGANHIGPTTPCSSIVGLVDAPAFKLASFSVV